MSGPSTGLCTTALLVAGHLSRSTRASGEQSSVLSKRHCNANKPEYKRCTKQDLEGGRAGIGAVAGDVHTCMTPALADEMGTMGFRAMLASSSSSTVDPYACPEHAAASSEDSGSMRGSTAADLTELRSNQKLCLTHGWRHHMLPEVAELGRLMRLLV